MALLSLKNTEISLSSLRFILSSKPFSHRGKNDWRLFIGKGDQLFIRVSYLLVFLCQFFLLDQPPNAEEPNSRDLYPDPILFHPCVTLNTIHVSFISKSVPQAQTGSQTLMVTIFSWISKRYLKIRRSGRDQLVGHQVLFNTCLFIGCTRP